MSSMWIIFVLGTCFQISTIRACMSGGSTPTLEVKCPDVVGDANFDLTKFSGEWYGVYTTNGSTSNSTKCVRMEFGVLSDGFLVTRVAQDTATKKDSTSAQKFQQDASDKYKFQPSTSSSCGFKASAVPVQTIITDYVSYAMIYSCSMQNGVLNEQGLLLSRTSSLSDEVKNKTTAGTTVPFYSLTHSGCGC